MRKFITIILTIALVFTMCTTAFATENENNVVPRAQFGFAVSSSDPTDSFYLGSAVHANSSTVRFDLNIDPNYNDGGIITLLLRRVDETNGRTYTYSIAVDTDDTGVHRRTIGVSLPADSYTVEIAYTPCHIFLLDVVFHPVN